MILVALLLPGQAFSQVRIVGQVIEDFTERPISFVSIVVRDSRLSPLKRIETDENGRFEFTVKRVTSVQFEAFRLGYEETTTPLLDFRRHDLIHVEIRLDPQAILLAPLEVTAWRAEVDDATLAGFNQRLETGLGIYLTREDVEARNPSQVTDLLRDVPGLQVGGGSGSARPTVRTVRSANRNCTTQIWVDGFLVNRRAMSQWGMNPMDFRIDDVVTPASVEGIEVYRGMSTVPPEFLNQDADCGVIAIWTKRGGRR